ncbi:diacylglycerol/lipid kinase family protein [Marivita sp. S0852]|uniref:diacylglycerol/lipid kinase family protein n=1 Tax=Marivita sp. S0852 TaxID=3373893 RepID=UPI003982B2E9
MTGSEKTARLNGTTISVLLNDQSGKKDAGPNADDIETAFQRLGHAVRVVPFDPNRALEDTIADLLRDDPETIVAAGGDGTISGVAQALLGKQCHFGILPRGTFNYFARSLGIPQDLDGAAQIIAQGQTRPLRIAMLNGQTFLNNANLGLYPQILRSREDIYDFWGRSRAAAYWSALKVLFQWPKPLVITIRADAEEKTLRTPMIFVLNNAFQLRQMGMEGADCIEEGRLAMLIAPDQGRLGMLKSAVAMLMGRAARHRDFHLLCATDFEVRAQRRNLLVARDGERCRMTGPFHFALSDDTLQTLVPTDPKGDVR